MRISEWSSDVCSSCLAKNFILLRQKDGGGTTVLAPLYDVVGTVVWPELSPRFAMTFGGAGTLEQLEAKHFDWFAADAGVAAPFVRRRASQLAEAVTDAIGRDLNVPGLDDRESIAAQADVIKSDEHTSELQSLMRISYAVFCLTKNKSSITHNKKTI